MTSCSFCGICLRFRTSFSLCKKHLPCSLLTSLCPCRDGSQWIDAAPSVYTPAQSFQSMTVSKVGVKAKNYYPGSWSCGTFFAKICGHGHCNQHSTLQILQIREKALCWTNQWNRSTLYNSKDLVWFLQQLTFDVIIHFNRFYYIGKKWAR